MIFVDFMKDWNNVDIAQLDDITFSKYWDYLTLFPNFMKVCLVKNIEIAQLYCLTVWQYVCSEYSDCLTLWQYV